MKLSTLLLWLCTAAAAMAAFPAELKLTNGVTLRKTEPIRWTKDYVVVRHATGVDSVMFRHIAEVQRAQVMDARPNPDAAKVTNATRQVTGQVFVMTKGAGAYKFGSAVVYAYPTGQIDAIKQSVVNGLPLRYWQVELWERNKIVADALYEALQSLPDAIKATTDADGRYTLAIPGTGDFTIYCATYRRLYGVDEHNVWLVPADPSGRVDLNNENLGVEIKR